MRTARRLAFVFTALCLLLAVVSMLGPTSFTFSRGATSSTVDCGSPAFPKSLIDFGSSDDAANCAGQTPATLALYFVLLAGLGLAVVAATSRATSLRVPQKPSDQEPDREPTSL